MVSVTAAAGAGWGILRVAEAERENEEEKGSWTGRRRLRRAGTAVRRRVRAKMASRKGGRQTTAAAREGRETRGRRQSEKTERKGHVTRAMIVTEETITWRCTDRFAYSMSRVPLRAGFGVRKFKISEAEGHNNSLVLETYPNKGIISSAFRTLPGELEPSEARARLNDKDMTKVALIALPRHAH
ncbi:hypothetical protein DFH06DRAFT_1137395 [Mycena polygramma]|nr:hypothetical protein DFH06DRAFT_1137395 [Mycena polygramma]